MKTERVSLQPGYVLHSMRYRDTSLIIETFTQDYGRVPLVARGVRKSPKGRPALLQPFTPLLLSWQSRSELGTLTGYESQPQGALPSGQALFSGFYVNELMLRMTHKHDPHPELFAHYRDCLTRLAAGSDMAVTLRQFEKRLLIECGYGLNFAHTVDGHPINPDGRYFLSREGGFLQSDETGETAGHREFSGSAILALQHADISESIANGECKQLLREAINAQLGSKPLQTPRMFRNMKASGMSDSPVVKE